MLKSDLLIYHTRGWYCGSNKPGGVGISRLKWSCLLIGQLLCCVMYLTYLQERNLSLIKHIGVDISQAQDLSRLEGDCAERVSFRGSSWHVCEVCGGFPFSKERLATVIGASSSVRAAGPCPRVLGRNDYGKLLFNDLPFRFGTRTCTRNPNGYRSTRRSTAIHHG